MTTAMTEAERKELGRLQDDAARQRNGDAADSVSSAGQADQADHNGDGASGRRLLFTPASKITPRPITWVWDTTPPGAGPAELQGRFPAGSLVLAVGRAGLGKSQFATWMTAQITNGTLPGCYHRSPQSVVYCAAEDSWEMTIVPRLLAAGADLDRVFHVRVADDGDPHARLTLPADTSCLEAGLATHQVVLVVLDPLLSMLDAQINDYRAREVRLALEPVVAVADRSRCLFLGLAHFTKATGTDPLLLVSGSGAFGQLIRAGVGFARDEQPPQPTDHNDDDGGDGAGGAGGSGGAFVLSQIKNNLGREELPSLQYVIEPTTVETPEGPSHVSRFHFTGKQSQRSVRDLLRGISEDPEATSDRDEAAEWLRDYLDGQPNREAGAKDIFKEGQTAGFAKHTLQRARKHVGARTQKSDFGGGWVWALPQPRPEDDTKNTKVTTHTGVSPSSSSLSSSGRDQGGSVWKLASQSAHHPVHSDHTSVCEPNGPNESRMDPTALADSEGKHEASGSQSAQSAHTPACEPTDPTVSQLEAEPDDPASMPADDANHARHARQHTEGGEHGKHGGEHGAETLPPDGDTEASEVPTRPGMSPSNDGEHEAAGFAWSMEAEPVGPCVVCMQACYSRGPDGRPTHPGCWTRGTPPGIADSGGTPDPGLGGGATGAASMTTRHTPRAQAGERP